MEDDKIASVSLELIQKDFGLTNDFEFAGNQYEEELIEYLIRVVQYLLDHDFEKLLNVMYRIDLPENRVKNVLTTSDPENLSRSLSELILDRERQKAKTRIQYSK
ncbi:MAG: hypothetical protein CMB80_14105 [Flammeovirgaceae bacterium]|nr:hypothetical protein [Flammeovirgaceae bacterium]MBE62143.1 hypothetical protein [Flammeovirgaceae bacterium]MBR09331.1 hypothetical protein [Rickettsiales bacterium]|tara:strand:+ start:2132 stop:2446 length:315 start_codon:yes stop_codon:yes gene_type:complete